MQRTGQERKSNLVFVAMLACLLFLGTQAWAAQKTIDQAPLIPGNVSLAAGKSSGLKKGQEMKKTEKETDPFKSFLALQEQANEKKKREKPRTYLETLDLSQLDLTATILNRKGDWAMVRDAKGVGHVIRKGTLIGTQNGVVVAIRAGEVVIRERYKDFMGKVITKDVIKKLPGQK